MSQKPDMKNQDNKEKQVNSEFKQRQQRTDKIAIYIFDVGVPANMFLTEDYRVHAS